MTVFPTRRLLPLLMLMAFVMLGQRGYDFWRGWQYGMPSIAEEQHPAPASDASPPAAAETHTAPVPAEDHSTTAAQSAADPPAETPVPSTVPSTPPPSPVPPGRDPNLPAEYTPAEVQVLQSLSQRRAELDRRAADLDQREALLQVTEAKVEDKIKELQEIRTQLEGLLHTVDQQQQERIASLVKLYETMKPQEAAAILETLDLAVALDILEQMKETKSALILAKMSPQKASEITVEMSRRHELPQIPQ